MQKNNPEFNLRNAIIQLENKQAEEEKLLKEQFRYTYESIKPVNVLKSILADASGSNEFKDNLVSTTVGLTAGFVSKLIFQGLTRNPVKKLAGTAIMFAITNLVAKNPDAVKAFGHKFFKIFKRKDRKDL
jgi:hypothetical protein